MISYAIWNNKGGTGKTSLAFQIICRYAEKNPHRRILVIDVCPQANLSELMLGGSVHGGSQKLLQRQDMSPRCSIGGYFEMRMPTAYQVPKFSASDYISRPHEHNASVPANIALVCGDQILEMQAVAMNSLANLQIPGVNAWLRVVDWLRDFLDGVKDDFDTVFMDTNPSFSMYTQIALAAADRIVIPVMADDSSRRAIQNVFSLVYGVQLPLPIYEQYTFSGKMRSYQRSLPKVHLVIKNRLTQYMGPLSAYAGILSGIDADLEHLVVQHRSCFTFGALSDGVVAIHDFGTTGAVAFAYGIPFVSIKPGQSYVLGDQQIQLKKDARDQAIVSVDNIVNKL